MSVIDMTTLRFAAAVPMAVEFGRVQRPDVGPAFRTDRLGNRWAFQFTTAPMAIEPEGRRWQARFDDAARQGGLFRVISPGFDVGTPGFGVTVAADTAAGRVVPLAGATAGYAIREGQWLSIVVDGQRYLDRAMEQATVASDGTGSVRIRNLIRVPLSAGDVVELAEPKIEGTVEMQNPSEWTSNRLTQFAFTVREDR